MNAKRVKALTLKELLVQSKDSATLSTIVVIPLLFGIAIPILLLLLGTSNPLVQSLGGMQFILDSASSFTVGQRVNAGSETLYVILMYFFIPIFMLLPTMISNVTAAASFVGEREQKTIEGLLYTPLTRQELIFGKIAASFLPATIVTWIAVIIYGLLLDTLGYPIFGRMIFPNATWVFLSIIITPLVSFLSTLLVVAISQKVKTTKSAQSVSLLVIVPIMGMIVYQANDLASLGFGTVILLAVIIFFVDVILFCFITHNFKSETFLIGK
jgi:ABC-2 type transport system permease protein